jgi:photosystem II stability/assembly factor-like uncharacterized protein
MKRLCSIGTFVLLLLGSLSIYQTRTNSRLPHGKLDGIVFLDSNRGFVQVTESPHPKTFETVEGGRTWREIDEGIPGFRRGRSFANQSKGWSIDESMLDHSSIYMTNNGGRTWVVSFKTRKAGEFVFGGLQAISESEAWAVGTHAYHTTDGGKTWEVRGPAGIGLQFLDSEHGWVNGDKLWHTADGGKTWQAVEEDGKSCFGGMDFFFLDENQAWAVGGKTEGNMEGGAQKGFITVTKDGGKTCVDLPQVPGQFFWSVFFLNEREGWVGGIGSLLKTMDGGHTWIEVSDGKSN